VESDLVVHSDVESDVESFDARATGKKTDRLPESFSRT
jgi:hypothetical protein